MPSSADNIQNGNVRQFATDPMNPDRPLVHAQLVVASNFSEIERIRTFVSVFSRQNPLVNLEEKDRYQLVIASHEIATNIIRHAYNQNPDEFVTVTADRYADRITIRFTHVGEPYRPNEEEIPCFDGSRENGFGLYIVEQAVDKIEYGKDALNRHYILLEKYTGTREKQEKPMEPNIEIVGQVTVVTIPGDSLDASNAKEFRQIISPVLDQSKQVVFDMSELRFVDSSGLGTLLSCLRQLNGAGGKLRLCAVSQQVRMLFELVRMHKIFDLFDTREEALNSF